MSSKWLLSLLGQMQSYRWCMDTWILISWQITSNKKGMNVCRCSDFPLKRMLSTLSSHTILFFMCPLWTLHLDTGLIHSWVVISAWNIVPDWFWKCLKGPLQQLSIVVSVGKCVRDRFEKQRPKISWLLVKLQKYYNSHNAVKAIFCWTLTH